MPSDISYLAGILDGEGSFMIARDNTNNSYTPKITVASTHKPMLDWLCESFKGKVYLASNATDTSETTYVWMLLSKRDLLELLPGILPELRIKRLQAWILLNFCEEFKVGSGRTYSNEQIFRREKYHQLLSIANSKGPGSMARKAEILEFYTVKKISCLE